MRYDKWMKGSVAVGAIAALWACSAQGPAATSQAPERQVLSVTGDVDIPAMVAQLPQRIPADQADELLVRVDPDKVVELGNNYAVLNKKDGDRRGFRSRRFHRGFSPGFRSLYRSFYYYPYSSYYFPYYSYGGYYYPYFFADRAYNPFFYGPGNNWIPAYWAR